jgi:hypothetical protein
VIANIIDHRKRPYRWKAVTAIAEAVWHDNSVEDADQAVPGSPEGDVAYDEVEGVSLAEAIDWAQKKPCDVTLYIYDLGRGTNAASLSRP